MAAAPGDVKPTGLLFGGWAVVWGPRGGLLSWCHPLPQRLSSRNWGTSLQGSFRHLHSHTSQALQVLQGRPPRCGGSFIVSSLLMVPLLLEGRPDAGSLGRTAGTCPQGPRLPATPCDAPRDEHLPRWPPPSVRCHDTAVWCPEDTVAQVRLPEPDV